MVASPADVNAPLREREIAGDDDRAAFVPLRDDLKEMAGFLTREREVTDFIDDKQLWHLDVSA